MSTSVSSHLRLCHFDKHTVKYGKYQFSPPKPFFIFLWPLIHLYWTIRLLCYRHVLSLPSANRGKLDLWPSKYYRELNVHPKHGYNCSLCYCMSHSECFIKYSMVSKEYHISVVHGFLKHFLSVQTKGWTIWRKDPRIKWVCCLQHLSALPQQGRGGVVPGVSVWQMKIHKQLTTH